MAAPDLPTYLVAGSRPWNRPAYDRFVASRGGERWSFVDRPDELAGAVEALAPRYVFFLHWSSIVPTAITERSECVCFHMTDVPYGRGGSPLQNLVQRGHTDTVLTALRMTDEVDAGPVYSRRPLSLAGTAEAVYVRATDLALAMAAEIVATEPVPTPQEGAVTVFTRRTPSESALPTTATLDQVVDFVRMLDADGYPRAFVEHGGLRLELSGADRYADRVEARVVITTIDGATTGGHEGMPS